MLAVRSRDVKQRQNQCNRPNLMTGKMYCEHCGRLYHRKMSKSNNGTPNSAWVCAGKIEHGAASCPSRYIYENEIKTILYETFRGDKFDVNSCVELYMKAYEAILSGNEVGRKIEEIKKEMEALAKKRDKLLEYNVQGAISDRDFLSMNASISSKLDEKNLQLARCQSELERQSNMGDQVQQDSRFTRTAGRVEQPRNDYGGFRQILYRQNRHPCRRRCDEADDQPRDRKNCGKAA